MGGGGALTRDETVRMLTALKLQRHQQTGESVSRMCFNKDAFSHNNRILFPPFGSSIWKFPGVESCRRSFTLNCTDLEADSSARNNIAACSFYPHSQMLAHEHT